MSTEFAHTPLLGLGSPKTDPVFLPRSFPFLHMQTSKISIAFRIGAGKLLSGEYQSVSTCVSNFLRDLPKLILAFLWFPFSFKTDQQWGSPTRPTWTQLMAPSFSGPRSIWGISAKEKLTFLWPLTLPQVSSGCISLDHMGSFVKWGCSCQTELNDFHFYGIRVQETFFFRVNIYIYIF